jgi:hypothetical protein
VLIAGIIVVVVGITDFFIAGLIARRETAGTGGLGAEPPRVALILRRSGALTIAVGVVLIVIGLASYLPRINGGEAGR